MAPQRVVIARNKSKRGSASDVSVFGSAGQDSRCTANTSIKNWKESGSHKRTRQLQCASRLPAE